MDPPSLSSLLNTHLILCSKRILQPYVQHWHQEFKMMAQRHKITNRKVSLLVRSMPRDPCTASIFVYAHDCLLSNVQQYFALSTKFLSSFFFKEKNK
jgi:hypothetical protein